MTTADLLKCMHDYDIIMHPYALYCNPDDAKELKEHIPETVKLIPLSFVDRSKFEKELYIPGFSFFGGEKMTREKMSTFYFNNKPLFNGKIESVEHEPTNSPLDLMNCNYLRNIEPERSVIFNLTNGIINEDIIKQVTNPKEIIDPYTNVSFNQTKIPKRKHHKKRIQKKWLKRYGYWTEEDAYNF